MKSVAALLLFVGTATAQPTPKIVTFNRADTEHCKIITVSGKPLLQSTYEGTSVAIAMPVNRGNGEFSIFVAVSQAGHGNVQIDPKVFYGLFSDTAHTRFTFYDKAGEHAPLGETGMSAANAQVDPGSIRPGAMIGGGPPPGGGSPGPGDSEAPLPAGSNSAGAYLRPGKVKPGSGVAGWITLRQSSGQRISVHPTDLLGEVDIPVNDILFRF